MYIVVLPEPSNHQLLVARTPYGDDVLGLGLTFDFEQPHPSSVISTAGVFLERNGSRHEGFCDVEVSMTETSTEVLITQCALDEDTMISATFQSNDELEAIALDQVSDAWPEFAPYETQVERVLT